MTLAQPILYGNEHRLTNGTYEVVKGSSFFPSPGDEGAGVIWSFRGLNGTSSTETISGDVPFSRFPANKRIKSESGSSFYVSTDDVFSLVGTTAGQQDTRYTLPIEIAQFPMNFGQLVTGSFAGTVQGGLSPISFRNGGTQSTYDGFGTLELPDATYNDVYRVKVVIDIEEFPIPRTLRSTRYFWFVKGSPIPVMRLTINEENLFGLYIPTGNAFKYVRASSFNQLPLAIEDISSEEALKIFPIPAKTELNINFSTSVEYVSLFDESGQLVRSSAPNNTMHKLNASDLPAGSYILLVETESKAYSRKVLIIK